MIYVKETPAQKTIRLAKEVLFGSLAHLLDLFIPVRKKTWIFGADMDREFFMLLDKLDVHGIRPLLDYYESHDAVSLTNKISSIPAFQNILSPMTETEEGWKIDWNSRYFTEDFPFGLSFIKTLCDSNNIDAPVITKVYEWGIANISKYEILRTVQNL